jgi:hypothetical protein
MQDMGSDLVCPALAKTEDLQTSPLLPAFVIVANNVAPTPNAVTESIASLLPAVMLVVVCTTPKVVLTVFIIPIVTTHVPPLPILMASYTPSIIMPPSGTHVSDRRCLDGYITSMSLTNACPSAPPLLEFQNPSLASFCPIADISTFQTKTYVEFKPVIQGGRNLLEIKKRNQEVSSFNSWELPQPNSVDYQEKQINLLLTNWQQY